jgi:K+-sensing histidine kinase KdpD
MTGPDWPAGSPSPTDAASQHAADRGVASQSATHGRAAPGRAATRLSRRNLEIVAGLTLPLALAAILVPFRTNFANTDAALAMILLVVIVAASGNRVAGYIAAASAAAWFDFFLTRPYEQFTISRATDIETTVLLLVIGIAVTEIAVWGRRQHAAASRRAGYLDGINDAARVVATGASPATLTDRIAASLTQLLSLRSCQFQFGVAGIGRPARLHHDGSVFLGDQRWDLRSASLPAGTDIELLVESGGRLQGRFLMVPEPDTRPTREQLLVAVALADQAGAALAASYPAET